MRGLTDRQIEIATLAAENRTYIEISLMLNLSLGAVCRHMREIKRKTSPEPLKKRQHLKGSPPTRRELQLLECLAKGLAYKEASTAMAVTEATVKFHAMNLLARLDARNSTHAVAIAFRMGLIR